MPVLRDGAYTPHGVIPARSARLLRGNAEDALW